MNELTKYFDKNIRPQDDFFQHVNGKWIAETSIPDDKPSWGVFMILREKSLNDVHSLFKKESSSEFSKALRYYNEGLDMSKRNILDFSPLKTTIDKINSMNSKEDLVVTLNYLNSIGEQTLFGLSSTIDRKNTSIEVPHIHSSGLSLPNLGFTNKDYYFDDDKKEQRKKYIEYLSTLFSFLDFQNATERANSVLEFETKLANKHFTQVQKRDYELSYNKFKISDLVKKSPNMNWEGFFKAFTNMKIDYFIVDNLEFVELFDNLLMSESLVTWKNYLISRILNFNAIYLSERFEEAYFNFYGKIIQGSKKLEERWKRILDQLNNRYVLGELVGKEYVKTFFPQSSKEKMKKLVGELINAMEGRIKNLEWMGEETKVKALKKLSFFGVKIGYPDKWEDYTTLEFLKSDTFLDIVKKCAIFNRVSNLSRLYKSPDKDIWGMSPQTVNAYYSPFRNEIVFPASILQIPFFDESMSWAENYGAIGTVIGHEITHGFDDKGSLFNHEGNMESWWTEEDRMSFEDKTKYFVDQYNEFLVNGKPVNGKLTLGENIADHGGIKVAYQALQNFYNHRGSRDDDNDTTSEQKFFLSNARLWRMKARPEYEELLRSSDPHSPPKARINVTFANLQEFYNAFGIKENDKLYRPELPNLW